MPDRIQRVAGRAHVAIAVAIVGALLSVLASAAVLQWAARDAASRLEQRADAVAGLIQRQIDLYVEVSRGLQGFFDNSEEVTRAEFDHYVDLLGLHQRLSGLQYVAFARHVTAAERASYERQLRLRFDAPGVAAAALHPPGERDEYLVVEHVSAPQRNRHWIGLDLRTVPGLASAISLIRPGGPAAVSESMPCARSAGIAGLCVAVLLPVSARGTTAPVAAAPHGGFTGTVAVLFDLESVIRSAVPEAELDELTLAIDRPPPDTSASKPTGLTNGSERGGSDTRDAVAGLMARRLVHLGATQWPLNVQARRSFLSEHPSSWLPWAVLLVGLLCTAWIYQTVATWLALHAVLASKLATAESRFSAMLANMLGMVYRRKLGADGRLEWASEGAVRLLGVAPNDLLSGRVDYGSLIHPDDLEAVNRSLHAVSETHPRLDVRYRLRHADGGWRWVRDSGTMARSEDGQTLQLDGYITDITAAKQAAIDAAESARFTRAALDALDAHIAVLDSGGNIVATNAAWDRFGLENAADPMRCGVGSNYLEACDRAGDDSSQTPALVAQAIRSLIQGQGSDLLFEYPCHSPTEQRWFYCRLTRFPGDGPMRIVVSHENISPVRAVERALLQSEARFRSTFEQAPVGIALAGPDALITQCNAEFARIVGYTPQELVGTARSELTHPDDIAADAVFKQRLMSGETDAYAREKRYIRKDGRSVWVRVTASAVCAADGYVDYYVVIVEDIHHRKLTELALQSINTDLTGDTLLQNVTRTLASLADVEIAFVGELEYAASTSVRARAFWSDGQFVTDFARALEGSPCARVVGKRLEVFSPRVREQFPDDELLSGLQIDSFAAVPLWSKCHRPLGLLGVMSRSPFRDSVAISKLLNLLASRIGAELESARDAKKFHDLFDSSPGAVLLVGEEGDVSLASLATERLFGWPRDALVGQPLDTLFAEDQRELLAQFHVRLAEQLDGNHFSTESISLVGRRRDGSGFPLEVVISRLDTLEGRATVAHLQDVTERERARNLQQEMNLELEIRVAARTHELELANVALANKEQEVRSVVETMVDAVIGIDERGIIRSANSAVENLLGYAAQELLGRNVSLLMPEPDRSRHDGYLENYVRTGEACIIGIGREVLGRHKAGHTVELELSVSEYSVQGRRYFTGMLRDIRERVKLVGTLQRARHDAEQANRAKSAFLASMSHEIRTPMNGVIGMIEVLQQGSLRSGQSEIVTVIRDSAQALLAIVDDVLDFSKIEAGQFTIDSKPFDVVRLFEGACGTLDQLAAGKGVELTLFVDPALPQQLLGDAPRLRQVLLNLMGNAIKFSSGQGRPARVSVRALLGGMGTRNGLLEFRVSDNGIGMDAQALSRLFKPFTQADTSTTRRFGGTGLGLSISHRLVELMGGEIAVKSQPGQGSVFSVQLPLVPVVDPVLSERSAPDLSGLGCIVLGGKGGVGDDLLSYLRHEGAVVERASDIDAADAALRHVSAGVCVCVVDQLRESLPRLRQGFAARADVDVRFVTVERGQRRRPRRQAPDTVSLDANLMHRSAFLQAVAMAGGRAHPDAGDESSADEELMTMPAPLTLEQGGGRAVQILVAEDNEINQKVAVKQLALLGYAAVVASNGREALKLWRQGNCELLLTDLHMPEMDGYDLALAIRESERAGQHFPIIALTANAIRGEAQRCHAAGMDDYITKPVQLSELKAAIKRWLPAARAGALPRGDATGKTEHAGATSAVDIQVLKALVGDDEVFIRQFLGDFRLSAMESGIAIRQALLPGQASAAAGVAHQLKSSARAVGAMALGDVCERLEAAGNAGQLDTLATLLPMFERELLAVQSHLAAMGHKD